MDPAPSFVLLLLGLLSFVWVATLLDALRHPPEAWDAQRRSKVDWLVRLGVFGWVAGFVYIFAVRDGLVAVRASD